MALSYAHDGTDPVGYWYEAALLQREAFVCAMFLISRWEHRSWDWLFIIKIIIAVR